MFYRQLGVMLNSGLDILYSLENIMKNTNNIELKNIISFLYKGVSSGELLAQCMKKFSSKTFTKFEINVILSGEKSGKLPEVLFQLAEYFESMYKVKSKIITGMLYPAILFHLAIIIPASPNLILKGIGAFLKTIIPPFLFIYGIIFSIILIKKLFTNSILVSLWDNLVIKIPLFGKLIRQIIIVRYLQSFTCLYTSGVGVIESIPIAAETMDNSIIKNEILKSLFLLKEGKTLSEAFANNPYIEKIVYDMIKTGEVSGKIDETLKHVLQYLQSEIETTIERIVKIAPVVVYLIVALYIAYIIISFYAGYLNQVNSLFE